MIGKYLIPFLVAVPCAAQNSYVVDQNRGPRTDFTDLPAAVAKAVDGDTLIVRRGSYSRFTALRAITILGEPGVKVDRTPSPPVRVLVRSIPTGRRFAMRGIDIEGRLEVEDSLGAIALHEVRCEYLQATKVSSLQMFQSQVERWCYGSGSNIAACESQFGDGVARHGISLSQGFSILAGCDVRGGLYWTIPQSAIHLSQGAQLTVTDNGTHRLSVAPVNSGGLWVISGSGSLVLDPRVVAVGAPVVAPAVQVTNRVVPYLRTQVLPKQFAVEVTLYGSPGHPFLLAVGAATGSVALPSLGGLWLNVPTITLVGAGTLDRLGRNSHVLHAPSNLSLKGLSVTWQGSAGPDWSQQVLSNPVNYIHGDW